ncbi:Ser/Thr protein kinase RdoA (MazF antagonist) [Paenibacillus sp. 4624]|jgi:Ser/Thr protein kinase RdoA (MazF antagonist)|uniref:Phosphotransferase n=1 Tax=Paenibacillus amylolyticus TaxID=1451 RepID=A0A5M9WU30_PAEAM|nr:phosphotransferase [Paenibacillus amylolyticus]KAA8785042.1 phosphotransferase [Paenibacillus amylolyticus]
MHENIDSMMIVKHALERYLIQSKDIQYLGESENLNYRIKAIMNEKENDFLLKIRYSSANQNLVEIIESELKWLEALESDLTYNVPGPVRNKEGEHITTITIDNSDEKIYVSLYKWVEGDLLNRPPTIEETISFAKLVAALHKQSKNWDIIDKSNVRVYDADNLISSYTQLSQNLNALITEEAKICLEQTIQKISCEINNQKITRNTWGMIHSDLHESNYVFYKDEPRPIDFSNCGLGFYLFDIAEIFMHLSHENQKVFISTYSTIHQLQDNYVNVIEAFFLWSIIRTFSFHSINPEEHENTASTLNWVIDTYCKKYLEDENFLLY